MKKFLIIIYINISFALCVSCNAQVKTENSTPVKKSTTNLLIGTWQSTQDPKFKVKIDNDFYYEIYKGTAPSALRYKNTNRCSCDDKKYESSKNNLLVTYEDDPADCYCYSIIKLDGNYLSLTYLGRGNTLTFKKVR